MTSKKRSNSQHPKGAERPKPKKSLSRVRKANPKSSLQSASEEATTKERILLAAVRVFGFRGFQGGRTAEIGKIAGVPQPLIYFHFANKLDLWNACAEHSILTTLRREEIVTEQLRSLEPNEALRFLLKSLVQRAHDDLDTARFYMRFGIEKELNPELDFRGAYTRGVELFRSNVVFLQDQGILPSDVEPTILSYILVGSAIQLYWNQSDFERLTGKSPLDDKVVEEHVAGLIRIFSGT